DDAFALVHRCRTGSWRAGGLPEGPEPAREENGRALRPITARRLFGGTFIHHPGGTGNMRHPLRTTLSIAALCVVPLASLAAEDDFAPYGTAKVDMHEYPTINAVFDVNYNDPNQLNILYNFVKNTAKPLKGKMVVVTHGPELRVFAKENYEKYQGIVQKMAEL